MGNYLSEKLVIVWARIQQSFSHNNMMRYIKGNLESITR